MALLIFMVPLRAVYIFFFFSFVDFTGNYCALFPYSLVLSSFHHSRAVLAVILPPNLFPTPRILLLLYSSLQ